MNEIFNEAKALPAVVIADGLVQLEEARPEMFVSHIAQCPSVVSIPMGELVNEQVESEIRQRTRSPFGQQRDALGKLQVKLNRVNRSDQFNSHTFALTPYETTLISGLFLKKRETFEKAGDEWMATFNASYNFETVFKSAVMVAREQDPIQESFDPPVYEKESSVNRTKSTIIAKIGRK